MADGPFPFEGKYILLAEDNTDNQAMIQDMMEYLNCKLDIANNGVEALEKWKRKKYDLVIMDIQMPIMDGYQASMEIRKLENNTKHTPIMALTASAMTIDRQKCFDSGMDDYLSKPINIDMFENKLIEIFTKFK